MDAHLTADELRSFARHEGSATDVGRIDTPVYICQGERDNSPDPHKEPSYYRASRDVTLHILGGSGHCHNFATTRHELWDRMHGWSRSLAAATAPRSQS